jgi:hypothetical protein
MLLMLLLLLPLLSSLVAGMQVSFVLAVFVGYTHPPGYQPDFGLVKPALPAIAAMTYSNDALILRNTLAAMALVRTSHHLCFLVFVLCPCPCTVWHFQLM